MKKILFPLVALVCSMSMNAQVMKIMKGTEVVATFTADQADNVVFEEAPAVTTTGTEKRTGNIDVNWVQLWKDGPKFAEYNVGVTDGKAESYGGYYTWAENIASTEWGSAWRMPTRTELEGLINNCDAVWTTVNGVSGYKYTGKGDYSSNSVFLPAAGNRIYGSVSDQGNLGYYWSSTPNGGDDAYYLFFNSRYPYVDSYDRSNYGSSVRAVLAE